MTAVEQRRGRLARAGAAVVVLAALAACTPGGAGGGEQGTPVSIEHVAVDPAYRGWWRSITIPQPHKPTKQGVVDTIMLEGDALFAPDSVTLSRDAAADLPKVAAALASIPGEAWVAGHTAITATPHANIAFSGRRAGSVEQSLIGHGVAAQRLHVAACGQRYPQSRGMSASDQARNRIVVIRVSIRPLSTRQACAPVPGK